MLQPFVCFFFAGCCCTCSVFRIVNIFWLYIVFHSLSVRRQNTFIRPRTRQGFWRPFFCRSERVRVNFKTKQTEQCNERNAWFEIVATAVLSLKQIHIVLAYTQSLLWNTDGTHWYRARRYYPAASTNAMHTYARTFGADSAGIHTILPPVLRTWNVRAYKSQRLLCCVVPKSLTRKRAQCNVFWCYDVTMN